MPAHFEVAAVRNVMVLVTFVGVCLVAAGVATRHATSAARSAPSPSRTHVVEMRGFVFEPAVLQVSPGDTVVWVNRDVAPHTATAADRSWDTGNVAPGQSARRIVAAAGELLRLSPRHARPAHGAARLGPPDASRHAATGGKVMPA